MIPSLQFQSRFATTAEDLRGAFAEAAGPIVVADLSLGSWTPQALAIQLLSQLSGQEMTFKANAATFSGGLGEAMSNGIDHDCKGNGALLEASATAARIARLIEQTGATVFVLTPTGGTPWRLADRLLLEYLASTATSLDLRFVVTAATPAPWPDDWEVSTSGVPSPAAEQTAGDLLSILPTALSPSLQRSLSTLASPVVLQLPNGWGVIAPGHRRSPAGGNWTVPPDVLANPALRNYAAYLALHMAPTTSEPWLFGVEAWKHFGSGHHELALLFMDAACEAARDATVRTTLTCHGQTMRIAMANYKDAGAAPDPAADLPEETRILLLQTKGWGLVMSGNAKEALPYLREALSKSKPSVVDKAYLFLMNITALAEVRSGHSSAALDLERAIDDLIAEHNVDDARLLFVNSLNLARLYRYSNDFDLAEQLYSRAFSTVEGARTTTDSINANLSLARIAELRLQPQSAFHYWLRGALHWLASENPEALNWRVQGLVLSKGAMISVRGITDAYQLVERLATSFLEQLERLSLLAGAPLATGVEGRESRFESPHNAVGATSLRLIGAVGWAVLGVKGGNAKPKTFGPAYAKLNRWMTAWLELKGGSAHDTYWIDPRDGSEMPRTLDEALWSAVENGVREIVYGGSQRQLTDADLDTFRKNRVANINPIVSRVDRDNTRTILNFRRYLKPYTLAADEQELFLALASYQCSVERAKVKLMAAGYSSDQFESTLARLRRVHAVQVTSVEATGLDASLRNVEDRELSACAS